MIQVNNSQETRIDTNSDTTRRASAERQEQSAHARAIPARCSSASELPSAVSAMVITSAMNGDTRATRSDSLVLHETARLAALLRPTSALSASRRLAIQPSPAHAAVASPMMPTEVRDAIAESIKFDQLLAKIAGLTDDLMLCLDVGEQMGLAGQHEAGDRETDHEQREQREDGEVGDARRVEVALAVLVALLRPHHVVEPAEAGSQPIQNARFGRFCHAGLPRALCALC